MFRSFSRVRPLRGVRSVILFLNSSSYSSSGREERGEMSVTALQARMSTFRWGRS